MENISNVLLIFGGIFLVIAVIASFLMQKNITNPNCPQDAANVKRNKAWSKGLLICSSIAVVLGAVLKLIR